MGHLSAQRLVVNLPRSLWRVHCHGVHLLRHGRQESFCSAVRRHWPVLSSKSRVFLQPKQACSPPSLHKCSALFSEFLDFRPSPPYAPGFCVVRVRGEEDKPRDVREAALGEEGCVEEAACSSEGKHEHEYAARL